MIFFRKRLLLDTDAQELARVKQILDQNQIPYDVKTTVSENALSRTFNAKAAEHVRSSYSAMSTQSYVYQLYVSPSTFKKARQLVSGKK